jgi:hypothetical protein
MTKKFPTRFSSQRFGCFVRCEARNRADARAAGGRKGGKVAGRGRRRIEGGETFATPKRDKAKRTRARIAAAVA